MFFYELPDNLVLCTVIALELGLSAAHPGRYYRSQISHRHLTMYSDRVYQTEPRDESGLRFKIIKHRDAIDHPFITIDETEMTLWILRSTEV